jgi:hypothetical protein
MDSSPAYSLNEMLDLVCQDGLIDSYETANSRVTFYQRGEVFSLRMDSAEDFLHRIVRAMRLDQRPFSKGQDEAP